jgi:small subunit ribosomal protein S7
MNPLQLKKLTNSFVLHGTRARADRLIGSILFSLKLKFGPKRSSVVGRIFNNLSPRVRLRVKRKAGTSYKIPLHLLRKNSLSYAFRWLRQAARRRPERTFKAKLLGELLDAYGAKGEAHRKRETVHQTALLNRGLLRLLK